MFKINNLGREVPRVSARTFTLDTDTDVMMKQNARALKAADLNATHLDLVRDYKERFPEQEEANLVIIGRSASGNLRPIFEIVEQNAIETKQLHIIAIAGDAFLAEPGMTVDELFNRYYESHSGGNLGDKTSTTPDLEYLSARILETEEFLKVQKGQLSKAFQDAMIESIDDIPLNTRAGVMKWFEKLTHLRTRNYDAYESLMVHRNKELSEKLLARINQFPEVQGADKPLATARQISRELAEVLGRGGSISDSLSKMKAYRQKFGDRGYDVAE